MASRGMKKEIVVVMVVVIMIVAAQAVAEAEAEAEALYGPPAGRHHRGRCASKCALRCLKRLRLTPVSYMLCFNLCMTKCRFMPSQSVFNCTSACATSKSGHAHTDDAAKVEGYVESCYNNCKIKH